MSDSSASRYRWVILAIFLASSAINYLDRQMLPALALSIQSEFHLSDAQYGYLLAAFNIPYAAAAPFAGLLIDRVGLNRAITLAIVLWSCAGIATGWTTTLAGLVACRMVLGMAEASGIPAAGKAIATYTKAGERAVGHAMNQTAVALGAALAPLLAMGLWWQAGWRTRFVVTGALGLLWIPLWLVAGRNQPPSRLSDAATPFRDRRLWIFAAANILNGVPYSIWNSWTTKYLAFTFGLDQAHANRYAWIPPVFAAAGGFLCGWASLRLVRRGVGLQRARLRVCVACAIVALAGLLLPFVHTPAAAAAGVSIAIGAVAGLSVNLYALPLDTFDVSRAAFAVSILVSSYGFVQAVISAPIGAVVQQHGYTPVIVFATVTPLIACAILRTAKFAP